MIKIVDDSHEVRMDFIERASFLNDKKMQSQVEEIITGVRENGDEALIACTEKFDGVLLKNIAVKESILRASFENMDELLRISLEKAIVNIRAYHQQQVQNSSINYRQSEVVLGQLVNPIAAVGLYIPGGSAAYPSTILMNVIPAQIAGCKRIVLVSPPGPSGEIHEVVLATAYMLGIREVYRVGGAQAIAALTYGTKTIAKVDKICGPGNAYVALAKKMVSGIVGIDMIAGPSEVLIIADKRAYPRFIAADLIAQAEHDANAATILLTSSKILAEAVNIEIKKQLPMRKRQEMIIPALTKNSVIIIVGDLDIACEVSNLIAPEHLELAVVNPFDFLSKIHHAGSIFLGNYTPEVLGDYFAGPNHTLPTNGTARFSSALSVDDFIKKSSIIYYSKKALAAAKQPVEIIAHAEGLDGHAYAMSVRFEEKE
ncbi:histidinol dehydrogenase [Erysipelotrichaceae bacterium]|nr:histidinol dehydrogenase [Erysipelotrichaceae bacterium]